MVDQFTFASEHAGRNGHGSSQLKVRFHNLPSSLTPLVGREQQVAAACDLLRRRDVRLLTLTGTGGIGKTRLGLQIATDLLQDFTHGVCFIPLAPISDPDLVIPTIAGTLGIKESGKQPPGDLLKAYLRDRHLLLLLDNFEQVVAAAPDLSDFLLACPHLKILVTSRAVLHVYGEHEFPVPPLTLPVLRDLPGRPQSSTPTNLAALTSLESEALTENPSIALFLQCALAVKSDFAITRINLRAIAAICVYLHGLPLAIELAAARVKLLPPQALLARLDHRLQVLTGGAKNAPPRQQTLRNTIAWSYNLLDPAEQQLFCRLSIFVGGCTLDAIESIYRTLVGNDFQVLDGVSSLIDKSLLQQIEQEGQEPRLVMLETVREYGLECLAAGGEEEITRQAHAIYYMRLAEEAEPELLGPQQTAWLDRLEWEHDNLRAALLWALEQVGPAKIAKVGHNIGSSLEIAMRLSAALAEFWQVRGHWSEGRNFLERALTAETSLTRYSSLRSDTSSGKQMAPVTPFVHIKVFIAAAHLSFSQSDYSRTEMLCNQSLALCRELGDRIGIATSLYWLGNIAWVRDNLTEARSLLEESLTLFRLVDYKGFIAWPLFTLALLHYSQGKYSQASSLFEESLALYREVGNKRGIAHTLSQLAQVLLISLKDQAKVKALLEECITLSREIGFKEGIAASLCLSGWLALIQSDIVTARSLVEESVSLYKEMGHRHDTGWSLSILARVVAAEGDYNTAHALYEESLAITIEVSNKLHIASGLEGLASVDASQDCLPDEQGIQWAVQLWGAAEALRETIGVPVPPIDLADYQRSIASVRARLPQQTFAECWAEGRTMTPEQAIAAQGYHTVPQVSMPVLTKTPAAQEYRAGLSAREIEVLCLVARGLTNAEIAQELVLSKKTVDAHLTHIFHKTNSDNRAAATAFAMRHGLI
jgi:predicted ATPase/DNA-binding CsgD family transcriptional regulator